MLRCWRCGPLPALVPALALLAAAGGLAGCGGEGEIPGFEREERLLFPELQASRPAVAAVTIEGGQEAFTLGRANGGWVVEERDGYPAEGDRVAALLDELAELRSIYVSTGGSPRYAAYGLAGPERSDGSGVRVAVENRAADALAALEVGHTFSTPGGSQLESVYVRRLGEDRVYLADSDLQLKADPMAWVDQSLVDLARERIYRVRLSSKQGESLVVRRARDGALTLGEDAEGAGLIEPETTLGPLTGLLERLSFRDVRSAGTVEQHGEPAYRASFRTFDGLRVSLALVERDDGLWALVEAEAVGPVSSPDEPRAEGVESTEAMTGTEGPESVGKEARTLAAATRGWAYRLPAHVGESLVRALRAASEAVSPEDEAAAAARSSASASDRVRGSFETQLAPRDGFEPPT